MQQLNLKKATFFILHGDLSMRTEIRLLLNEQNAKSIEFGKITDLVNTIKTDLPAALIACADQPTHEIVNVMSHIRLGKLGKNPFLPTIAITNDDSDTQWNKLVNAGFNLILHSPFSRANIWNTVKHLSMDNRNFIVSKEYVGPQRIVNNQPERLLPHITPVEAPNTLEGIVKGAPVNEEDIYAAFDQVTEERVKNAAYMTLAKFEQSIQKAVKNPQQAFAEMVGLCTEALKGISMTSIANAKPSFETCRAYAKSVAEYGFDDADRELSLELIDALSRNVLQNHHEPQALKNLQIKTKKRIDEKRTG